MVPFTRERRADLLDDLRDLVVERILDVSGNHVMPSTGLISATLIAAAAQSFHLIALPGRSVTQLGERSLYRPRWSVELSGEHCRQSGRARAGARVDRETGDRRAGSKAGGRPAAGTVLLLSLECC